jgi:hypothetical protein
MFRSIRPPEGGLHILIVCLAAGAALTAQTPQPKWTYPLVRDQRGVVPPGPKVPPYNSPPLGDGPWMFESYERPLRVVGTATV